MIPFSIIVSIFLVSKTSDNGENCQYFPNITSLNKTLSFVYNAENILKCSYLIKSQIHLGSGLI